MAWRSVVGYEGLYEVSDDGAVRSLIRRGKNIRRSYGGVVLKPWINQVGNVPMVTLYRDYKATKLAVHRLVLTAFVGPCPDGLVCCHYNGNPSDNRLENLRWDTQLSNAADKRRHGRSIVGEKNKFSKLTSTQVIVIKKRLASGEQCNRIAEDYGVTPEAIGHIKNGKNWAWLGAAEHDVYLADMGMA